MYQKTGIVSKKKKSIPPIKLKRTGKMGRRPLVDIQIGAFALRHQGLLPRNASDF
jgi:hypothetical protein